MLPPVRFGLDQPRKDLEQNTIATFNVLEAMRANDVGEIAFSSTGSIYGEATVVPTPEDAPFPVQTSLYGASKLACEGMIAAYAEGYGIKARIFRFVSILGQRYSHGHIFDFMMQLAKNQNRLHILGDGKQRKSYLHVEDCIEAMLLALNAGDEHVAIFNLGTDEVCQVLDSVDWIVGRLKLSPQPLRVAIELIDQPGLHLAQPWLDLIGIVVVWDDDRARVGSGRRWSKRA